MMTIQPSDFWVADIPYTSSSASKKRPILVLWLDGDDVVAAVVTSAKPTFTICFAIALQLHSSTLARSPSDSTTSNFTLLYKSCSEI